MKNPVPAIIPASIAERKRTLVLGSTRYTNANIAHTNTSDNAFEPT